MFGWVCEVQVKYARSVRLQSVGQVSLGIDLQASGSASGGER